MPDSAPDLETLTKENAELRERLLILDRTPFARLTCEAAKFAMSRVKKGEGLDAAANLAERFCALTAEQRDAALARERTGLPLPEAISAVLRQTANDEAK